jgi:hypothetical protein
MNPGCLCIINLKGGLKDLVNAALERRAQSARVDIGCRKTARQLFDLAHDLGIEPVSPPPGDELV